MEYMTSSTNATPAGTKDCMYALLHAPGQIMKQRFVEDFSGQVLDDFTWATYVGGSGGAIALSDSVDGGLEIKSSTTNMSLIDFAPSDAAKKRPFNYNGCVQITTAKLTNVTNAIMRIGMRSNYRTEGGSYVRIQLYGAAGGAHGSQENIISINSDNFSVTNTDITSSSTPSMFDWLTHKIECKSSTTEYSINGILKVTASGIPDEQLMPFIEVKNEEGTAASNPIGNVRYMECYNT